MDLCSGPESPGVPDTSPTSEKRPQWMRDGMPATEVNGPNELRIVGESSYQSVLWAVVGERREYRIRFDVHVVLVAEDDGGISAWINGRKVGHLGRDDARRLRPGLIRLQREHRQAVALPGLITGGGSDGDHLSVFATYDAAAFGQE